MAASKHAGDAYIQIGDMHIELLAASNRKSAACLCHDVCSSGRSRAELEMDTA